MSTVEEEEEELLDELDDLDPAEIKRREQLIANKGAEAEQLRRDLAIERSSVTVTLRDKGTRIGCELWTASGIIVIVNDKPCVLALGPTVPDAYHAGKYVYAASMRLSQQLVDWATQNSLACSGITVLVWTL